MRKERRSGGGTWWRVPFRQQRLQGHSLSAAEPGPGFPAVTDGDRVKATRDRFLGRREPGSGRRWCVCGRCDEQGVALAARGEEHRPMKQRRHVSGCSDIRGGSDADRARRVHRLRGGRSGADPDRLGARLALAAQSPVSSDPCRGHHPGRARILFGVTCPLTWLEFRLRAGAGSPLAADGFIAYWLQRLIFYDAPSWVFTLIHTAFAAIVAANPRLLPAEKARGGSARYPRMSRRGRDRDPGHRSRRGGFRILTFTRPRLGLYSLRA